METNKVVLSYKLVNITPITRIYVDIFYIVTVVEKKNLWLGVHHLVQASESLQLFGEDSLHHYIVLGSDLVQFLGIQHVLYRYNLHHMYKCSALLAAVQVDLLTSERRSCWFFVPVWAPCLLVLAKSLCLLAPKYIPSLMMFPTPSIWEPWLP